MKKVILYISMSLDGYLATKDDDLSWLSVVQDGDEDYGYAAFNAEVDTYIVGRKTYDIVKKLTGGEFPAAKQHQCYVLTKTERESEDGVTFYSGDVVELINRLKQEANKNIYCDGGAKIVQLLMQKGLIDEYIISIIPTLLGDGIRLFQGDVPGENLSLISSKSYPSGLVQVHYGKKEKRD